jgi:heme exporter protein C
MSELLLLLLFLGYMALRAAFDDRDRADRVSAILAVIGLVNVPIIHFSVEWWSSLHQPATITQFDAPTIDTAMLIPLLVNIAGFTLLFVGLLFRRLQAGIVERETGARWLRDLAGGAPS